MLSIRQTANAGLGAFASKPIPRGTRILSERALISILRDAPQTSILKEVKELSKTSKENFMALSVNDKKYASPLSWLQSLWLSKFSPLSVKTNHTILNIFLNNNFQIEGGIRSLFPQVARMNHSCLPNAQGNFNPALEIFTVHAIRDIEGDEEIRIGYLKELFLPAMHRMRLLKGGYGFTCDCPLCDPFTGEAADMRRMDLQKRMKKHAMEPAEAQNKTAAFELMRHAVDLVEADDLRGREIASFYLNAANLAAQVGEDSMVKGWVEKALLLEEDAVGADSPMYAETVENLQKRGFA